LPASATEKRVSLPAWKEYQRRLPTTSELQRWFRSDTALCLVAGAVSGNLELIDFDCGGERFAWWQELVNLQAPGLMDSLVLERSPSGGWHVIYRCESPVCGNIKLAERAVRVDRDDEVELHGKRYKPRRVNDRWEVWLTLIETRGEGGIFLCDPTPGYALVQGRIEQPPTLSEQQRELLLDAAWSLNELQRTPTSVPAESTRIAGRPGDDFNARGDVRALLRQHGWTLARDAVNQYWRRPGKDAGWSATLREGTFYVFSSSAAPFEPNCAYSPFHVYALLEHGGDFSSAAAELRRLGFGGEQPSIAPVADPREASPLDPGPMPGEMLRVPGLVSEVMDLCLATAPYPNQSMAFCGALALQAFLAARKVRDPGDNRTNVYLLGLAHSSAGKDWIRKVNAKILHEVGLSHCMGDRLASGEGIQDAMFSRPSMFFQTDEIDSILQSINKAKDARHESIMSTLLTMYSSSNSVFCMRPKAGRAEPAVIDQPSLVLFGTAIPNHYYEALSERMLTNGFFARMVTLEGDKRGCGQEPTFVVPSQRLLEIARWWANYRPGTGNLDHWNPQPAIVEYSDEALRMIGENRELAAAEYSAAESRSDAVGTTVWGRVNEQSRKLALIYAVSENHGQPRIGANAVGWATNLVAHQTRRMLYMAAQHVADNPFDAECLKLIQKLKAAEPHELPHSVLLKRMKIDAKRFREIIDTLEQRGEITAQRVATGGRTGLIYSLR
jgi:hypothetical protein